MTVDEVRKALEEIRRIERDACESFSCPAHDTAHALITEGLKVLDDYAEVKIEYEKALKSRDDDGYREYILAGMRAGEQQINLIAAILRTAGRLVKEAAK